METRYKALSHGHIFVDFAMLHKGIYAAATPKLWPYNTTLQSIKDSLDPIILSMMPQFSPNLMQCTLVDVLMFEAPLELIKPQKDYIVEEALKDCGHILFMTSQVCDIPNFIEGTVETDDLSWRIKIERISPVKKEILLANIDMSIRAFQFCKQRNIETISQLAECDPSIIKTMISITKKELEAILKDHNLAFKHQPNNDTPNPAK